MGTKKLSQTYNLLVNKPSIAAEWHPTRNGDAKPQEFTVGSKQKIWWQCKKEHEWEAMIQTRTRGSNCPFCSGNRAGNDNNLAVTHPEIAYQWHPTKNQNLKPQDLTSGSSRKVWWKCEKYHEWEAVVSSRRKHGCPYCSGHKVTLETSLSFLRPDLAKEWHPSKNGKRLPVHFTSQSNSVVWWKCGKGADHEWQTSISNRFKGKGCPFCSGRRATKENNLTISHPDLIKEWHPIKNSELRPEDFKSGSDQKIWWFCKEVEDHIWEASIYHRTSGSDCPYCFGMLASADNNLVITHPNLAMEWHPTKNSGLRPEDFKSGSDQKIWWSCIRNISHVWHARISSRISGTNCPFCKLSTSIPEIRLYCELVGLFGEENVFWRHKFKGVEMDIYIPFLNIAIEYDGYYWHKDNFSKDKNKNDFFKKENIHVLRCRDHPLMPISVNDILSSNNEITKTNLDTLLNKILMLNPEAKNNQILHYLSSDCFTNDLMFVEFLKYLPSPPPKFSLLHVEPKIAKEWHFEKNYPLRPENFTRGSSHKAWWCCSKDRDHIWQTAISNRTGKIKTGCPFCSNRKVDKKNCLAATHPSLAKYWHPTKNGLLRPEDVTYGSGKKVWWQCDAGHSSEAVIEKRARYKTKKFFCKQCLKDQ